MGPEASIHAPCDVTQKSSGDNQTISVGGYDGTYNLATRGNLYQVNAKYAISGSYLWGWVKDVALYSSYDYFQKSNHQFSNTQRWIAGTAFSLKFLSIYLEWRKGATIPISAPAMRRVWRLGV